MRVEPLPNTMEELQLRLRERMRAMLIKRMEEDHKRMCDLDSKQSGHVQPAELMPKETGQ